MTWRTSALSAVGLVDLVVPSAQGVARVRRAGAGFGTEPVSTVIGKVKGGKMTSQSAEICGDATAATASRVSSARDQVPRR